jgi:ubiquinone/menaquinone biosynthesis C-methylase UbiE
MNERIIHEKKHGEKIAANAEAVWNWSSPAGQKRAERRANYLIEIGKIKSTDRVLEIGCGTGLFTGKIYNATHASLTAIDISEDLLNRPTKIKTSRIQSRRCNEFELYQ